MSLVHTFTEFSAIKADVFIVSSNWLRGMNKSVYVYCPKLQPLPHNIADMTKPIKRILI